MCRSMSLSDRLPRPNPRTSCDVRLGAVLSCVLHTSGGICVVIVGFLSTPAWGQALTGQVSAEVRGFFQAPLMPEQPRATVSAALQPELYFEWGDHSVLTTPFFRWDQTDAERTRGDIRELLWQYAPGDWELRVGVGRVFWGVTESQHLVDIINQTDLVENLDGEDKLGQPMVNVAFIRPWGTLDLFVLPGFRTRTFPGPAGRPQFPYRVATELAEFESPSERSHVDVAARWAHVLGDVDIGVAHFRGTTREPDFALGTDAADQTVIIPIYDQIDQTSLDLSWVAGNWLWKHELINRAGQGQRFAALTGGFEYTLVGIFDSTTDLGLLAEYSWDERGKLALSPFDNDLFVASRLGFNDVQGTALLSGVLVDLETGGRLINIEGSRRIGDRWRVYLEVRSFIGIPETDFMYGFRVDDYALLEVARFF